MKKIRGLKDPTPGLAEYLDYVGAMRIGTSSALTFQERRTRNSGSR